RADEVDRWRSPPASVKTAVPEAPVGKATVVEPIVVMDMVKTMGEENRTADKKRRPIEPGIPPVVWLGVRIQIDRLWRQRVDLLRQAGRILRDPPAAIRLLARLPDGLLRLSSDHHLHGELAAILAVALRLTLGRLHLGKRRVCRARRDLGRARRQGQHHCDSQKGMRISISRNRPPDRWSSGLVHHQQVGTPSPSTIQLA
ncbi:MAG: hypothetical protein ACXWI5_11650, partial [Croceibacterium sp.]